MFELLDALEADPRPARHPRPYTLGASLARWLEHVRIHCRPSSAKQAAYHVAHLERLLGASLNCAALRPRDIDQLIARRLAEGVSRSSINGTLRYLRAALRYAVEVGKLEEVPLRVKQLKVTRKRPHILADEEIVRLLRAVKPPLDLVVLLAADAGLRVGEIVTLQRRDVDLRANTLAVQVKPELDWSPKGAAERAVPLSPRLRQALEERLEQIGREPAALLLGGMTRFAVAGKLRRALEAAGLYVRWKTGAHALRRSWASRLSEVASVEVVRAAGGWEDYATVRRYVRAGDRAVAEGIAALARRRGDERRS